MLLRNPISGTKRLFQRTIRSVKSLFSGGYEKLPKHPPPHPMIDPIYFDVNFQTNSGEFENFRSDFSRRWDSGNNVNTTKGGDRKKSSAAPGTAKTGEEAYGGKQGNPNYGKGTRTGDGGFRGKQGNGDYGGGIRRNWWVFEKLRELELMDMSNLDHVLDIEEVLHYYSRLTCPAYLDIVDRFFVDLYSEFSDLPAKSGGGSHSRRKL